MTKEEFVVVAGAFRRGSSAPGAAALRINGRGKASSPANRAAPPSTSSRRILPGPRRGSGRRLPVSEAVAQLLRRQLGGTRRPPPMRCPAALAEREAGQRGTRPAPPGYRAAPAPSSLPAAPPDAPSDSSTKRSPPAARPRRNRAAGGIEARRATARFQFRVIPEVVGRQALQFAVAQQVDPGIATAPNTSADRAARWPSVVAMPASSGSRADWKASG